MNLEYSQTMILEKDSFEVVEKIDTDFKLELEAEYQRGGEVVLLEPLMYDYDRFTMYMSEEDYRRAYNAMTLGLQNSDIIIRKGARIAQMNHNSRPFAFADTWTRVKMMLNNKN